MEKINLHCNLWVAIIFYYVPHFKKFSAILFIGDRIVNDQIPSTHLEACITRASQKELKHTIQIHIEKLVPAYYYLTKLGGAKKTEIITYPNFFNVQKPSMFKLTPQKK